MKGSWKNFWASVSVIAAIGTVLVVAVGLRLQSINYQKIAVKSDPLIGIYSELKPGMGFAEVRNVSEKYYPDCHLIDTDIWMPENIHARVFFWILGKEAAQINDSTRTHRFTLRMDFNKNDFTLVNAVYMRFAKKEWWIPEKAQAEERKALVGDGYYKPMEMKKNDK